MSATVAASSRRTQRLEVLRQLVVPLRPQLGTLAYTLRTMLAIGLALFVSFSLQLPSPISSVTTVLIVANPLTGALVSKSVWRLFGTVLGATVAVALMAAFAQTPILFTVALSLCIGLACVVASLLRYFRAYGAVLAGYTIIIVTSGTYMDPQDIFTGALARVSAVSVGIVSATLVFLLASLPIPSTLTHTIENLVRDIAGGFMFYRRPEGLPDPSDLAAFPRPALLVRANALDEAIEYASADSYVLRRRMGRLRLGAARLLGLLAVLEPLHDDLRDASPDAHEAQTVTRSTMAMLSQLPPGGLADSLPRIETARARVDALAAGITEPASLTLALHQRDVLEQLAHAVADLTGAGPAETRIRLRPYLEWLTAFRNGMRGLLVTLIGGLFWYVTQWTAGPVMLSFLVPAACLLSTNPFPSKASIELATGAILAIGGSMLCQTFVLPQISGFPLLWGGLCLCLAPGIWLQFHPVHRNRAFGYVVFFNAMINVHNPITYDDIGLLNGWLAFLLGALCLMMVFRVLLPANPPREVRRLAASLGRAIELLSMQRPRLLGVRRLPGWEVWQNQQMQKILRLIQRLQQVRGVETAPLVQAAFVVVALGRIVLMLQGLLRNTDLPKAGCEAAATALRTLRRLRHDPVRVATALDALQHAMLPLLHADPGDAPPTPSTPQSPKSAQPAQSTQSPQLPQSPQTPQSRAMHLLVGALGEAALLIRKAQGLLTRDCPLFAYDATAR